MSDRRIWSLSVGQWGDLHVRVHMFFLLFGAFTIYFSCSVDPSTQSDLHWLGPATLGILFISVLLHELGHVWVARKLDGHLNEVTIGPLGGLGPMPRDLEPQSDMVNSVAGPLINLGLCFIAAFALAIAGESSVAGLMHPFAPVNIMDGSTALVLTKLAFWVNWMLILVNLIPAFPFDGGRLCHSTIQCCNPNMERYQVRRITARIGKVASLCLLITACVLFSEQAQPLWFAMLLLSIFVFFSARNHELQTASSESADDGAFLGYDFSEGYTSLERSMRVDTGHSTKTRPKPGMFTGWLARRRELKRKQIAEREAADTLRLDEILSRVHELGLENLSNEEKAILNRVSQRLRKKSPTQ
ncbi:MAG: hypothetical protein KDA87_10755 [Planctomycetales bacterium]|nr:hypothetical protein [Planctomycetales bacterium]